MENNQRKIAIYLGVAIVVMIALSVIVFLKSREVTKKESPVVTLEPTPTPVPGETVMVTVHGFVPETLTVKKGTWINFANFSETTISVESKDGTFKPLNIGVMNDNDTSDSVQYNEPGTYEYHNKYKPEQKAKIVIE